MVNPKPAVYAIVNKVNNKRYIGGATYPSQRWYEHKSALRLNRHRNHALQLDWNTLGEINFCFSIIEEVDKEYLSVREDYHIKNSKDLYNNLSGYTGRKLATGENGRRNPTKRKSEQRRRDKEILNACGIPSLEGVMSAIRKLDTNGLENLQTILCGRNDQAIEAINKARQKTRRTRQAEVNQALRRG